MSMSALITLWILIVAPSNNFHFNQDASRRLIEHNRTDKVLDVDLFAALVFFCESLRA